MNLERLFEQSPRGGRRYRNKKLDMSALRSLGRLGTN